MKKFVFLLLFLIPVITFAAPKGVSVSTSNFDGAKEVTLKPYGTSTCMGFGKTCVSVGALWRSTEPQIVALELVSLRSLINMSHLAISADGDIIVAERVPLTAQYEITGFYRQSAQRFFITKSDLDKILNAKKVWMKISVVGGSYIETNLINDDKSTLARDGLIRFRTEI